MSDATTPQRSQRWVALVTACVFGPYLTGGFRTEQVAVYLSVLIVLVVGWRKIAAHGASGPLPFLLLWSVYLAVALISYVGHANHTAIVSDSTLAGVDNLALPLAVLLVTWYWTAGSGGYGHVKTVAKVIIYAMAANAVVSFYSVAKGTLQPFGWLPQFWNQTQGGGSVALNSLGNGRYTGIFNQPAEAGICYSLAAFCLLYLAQAGAVTRSRWAVLLGGAITLGGVLSVSKMFLLGGLPIIVFFVLRDRTRRARIIGGSVAVALTYFGLHSMHLLPNWVGSSQLNQLFDANQGGFLTRITAGRFGSHGTLGNAFSIVWHAQPFGGVGVGGLAVPYDSAWIEAMIVAGLVGMTLLACVQGLLLTRWIGLRSVLPGPEWRLAGATVLLIIGSSFGLPTLTANRVSTLCWLLLGLLITARSYDRRRELASGRAEAAPNSAHHHANVLS